jgi:hypothetical protein
MLLLLFFFVATYAFTACGYNRLAIGDAPSYCSSRIVESDCSLAVTIDRATGNFYPCNWNPTSLTCSQGTTSCRPSCFAGARHSVSTCSSPCDSGFTGGFGTSQICYTNSAGTCSSVYCDYSCSGYNTVSSCLGLTHAQCTVSQQHTSTGDNLCTWDGFGCVSSSACIKICNGVNSVTNCSLSAFCDDVHETRSNGYTYDCTKTQTGCASTYPTGLCYNPGTATGCSTTHTFTGDCTSMTTPSTCNNKYSTDSNGNHRLCFWTPGAGCFLDAPCFP